MRWTADEIDKARMLIAAMRGQNFGSPIDGLAARFQLSREDAVALLMAAQGERV